MENPPPDNPYASPVPLESEPGVYMLGGHLTRKGFLHRTITFTEPFSTVLDYDGKLFRQRLLIGNHMVWFRISWLRIHPRIEFWWPPEVVGESDTPGIIEIQFDKALRIQRFSVTAGMSNVYEEINA